MKFSNFTSEKNPCLLHGQVFVMLQCFRFVTIMIPGRTGILTLCEVEIYGGKYLHKSFDEAYEPVHETKQFWFRPGPTQTWLYNHRKRLEAWNFGFKKKRNCTIRVAETKALICFAVTAKLICTFVFTHAYCWFSHAAAHSHSICFMFRTSHGTMQWLFYCVRARVDNLIKPPLW